MKVLETDWWTLAVPPEWWAEAEEDSILVGDHDDVGCIEITTLHKDSGEFDADSLQQIAAEESEHPVVWSGVTLGEFRGVTGSYMEEGVAIREWYVANGPMMLFITYSCEEENRGMDDAAVDELSPVHTSLSPASGSGV